VADLLHPKYLPFTADQLREHFAPVVGAGEKDRHLTYYRASVDQARKYAELIRRGKNQHQQRPGWVGRWRKTKDSGWQQPS
jgi:hypothetical protein